MYGYVDLIGDLGGVFEIIAFLIGIVVLPFATFGFYYKVLQRLFYARTCRGGELFNGKSVARSKDFPLEYQNTIVEKVLGNVYKVNIKTPVRIKMFCCQYLKLVACCKKKCLSANDSRMIKLMDKGKELYENEININTFIKKIRRNRIYLMKFFKDKDINFEVRFDHRNIINIDENKLETAKNKWHHVVDMIYEAQDLMDNNLNEKCSFKE